MFKSNFSRYVLTFGFLILISFSAVSAIMFYGVIGYARNSKKDTTYDLAKIIFEDIQTKMTVENKTFRSAIAEFHGDVSLFEKLSKMLDTVVFITDTRGVVLYVSGVDDAFEVPHMIDDNVIDDFYENSGVMRYGNLGGILPHNCFNTAFSITVTSDGIIQDKGLLILSTADSGVDDTMEYMLISVSLALIWVFAAAFTALYFIGERLNKPIVTLKKKLEAFSKGDYSVRMKPSGVKEFDVIAESFNSMAESLEKIENSRRNFLSDVSHDLRTPMTSIQGFVDAIVDGTIKPDKQKHYLEIISKEIKRLSRLVNSLLDIVRMESGKLEIEKSVFDLCEMARLIVISMEERLMEKNIEFNLDSENDRCFVFADKDAIYQVMYNLIDNAVKFTSEGGNIRVIIAKNNSQDDEENKKYLISVYNTGVGISEEEKNKVFNKFFKADFSRGADKSGVGLGLFIVKTKLDAHKEKISVDSEYGKYCRFDFTLPRREASDLKQRPQSQLSSASKSADFEKKAENKSDPQKDIDIDIPEDK